MRDTKPLFTQKNIPSEKEINEDLNEIWMKIEESIGEHETKKELENFIEHSN